MFDYSKFRFLNVLFFTILSVCHYLSAEIIDIVTFEQVNTYLIPEALIILDIDNTLMEPQQELGSDQWFYHRIECYKLEGLPKDAALDKALSEWTAIQSITKVKAVEPYIPTFVSSLQEDTLTVMGLTTRGLGLATRTIEQLKTLDIQLAKTAPSKEETFFTTTQGILYREGVLFTAGSNKGQALFKLLDQIEYHPEAIIFVNDKATHLRDVELACIDKGIPFLGLRYGFLDQKVKNFRQDLADKQLEHFGHILSNEEAEKLLKAPVEDHSKILLSMLSKHS
jgi:hypothetical protein